MIKLILKVYYRLRFGNTTTRVIAIDGGVVSEYEVKDRKGRVVGYWAYGHYDPTYPYRCDL